MDRNHKTAAPAILIFDEVGIAYFEAYIHILCPKIACVGSPLNILSWNGNAMAPGTISR